MAASTPIGPLAVWTLPDVTDLATPFAPTTLPSAGADRPDYRATGVALPDGGMVMAAIPLTGVESAVTETRRILVAAGTGALVIVAAIVWLSIRRGLRPSTT